MVIDERIDKEAEEILDDVRQVSRWKVVHDAQESNSLLFEEMVDICRGSCVNELGTISELAKNAVRGPKKAPLAGILETVCQLRGERWEKRKSRCAVAENHITPAAADSLENGRTIGEILGNSGHYG